MEKETAATRPPSRIRRAGWWLLLAVFALAAPRGAAAEMIFLQDGSAVQVDKVEPLGDHYRVERNGKTLEIPRADVMSIHPTSPPSGTPGTTSPAEVYRDLTRDMNEKVRREIRTK
ncbi:MAG: hypothetical protein HY712_02970 [candidate division NC10 bacterium]|nr:hypothetical protein [candidate division NC10 bacterium]